MSEICVKGRTKKIKQFSIRSAPEVGDPLMPDNAE